MPKLGSPVGDPDAHGENNGGRCDVRQWPGFESAKAICFDMISHVTVRMDHVFETRPFYNPVGSQMNEVRSKGLIDVRSQPFAVKQSKSCLVFTILSEQNCRAKRLKAF